MTTEWNGKKHTRAFSDFSVACGAMELETSFFNSFFKITDKEENEITDKDENVLKHITRECKTRTEDSCKWEIRTLIVE